MGELLAFLKSVQEAGAEWGWIVSILAVGAWLLRCWWVERTKVDAEAGVMKADAYQRGMEASGELIDRLTRRNDYLAERNDVLVRRINELEDRLSDLEQESGESMTKLRAQVAQLQTENQELREALERECSDKTQLLRENEDLRQRVADLERVVKRLEATRCEQGLD